MITDLLRINLLKNNTKAIGRKDMNPNNKNFRISLSPKLNNTKNKMTQNSLEPLKWLA